jgi:hypothetical protein
MKNGKRVVLYLVMFIFCFTVITGASYIRPQGSAPRAARLNEKTVEAPIEAAPKADNTTDSAMRNGLSILDFKPTDNVAVKILKGVAGIALSLTACSPNSPSGVTPDPVVKDPKINSASATPTGFQLPGAQDITLKVEADNAKAYEWTTVEKPDFATVTITNEDKATATATGLSVAGTYKFKIEVTGENDVKKSKEVTVTVEAAYVPTEYTFSYPAVTIPGPTLNFKPNDLPSGVTYTLSNAEGPVSHVDGVVSSNSFPAFSIHTFTQIFYKDGGEIGRTVVRAGVGGGSVNFTSFADADDNTITKFPDVTLTY